MAKVKHMKKSDGILGCRLHCTLRNVESLTGATLSVVSVDQSRQDTRIPSTVFSSSSLTLRLRTPHVGIEE
eukprot:scaffold1379_cov209-Alexandrium_tamarense.AAC.4